MRRSKKPKQDLKIAAYARAQWKSHAYHEAGHAVAEFVRGDAGDVIRLISMQWDDDRWAYVRRDLRPAVMNLDDAENLSRHQQQLYRSVAVGEALSGFAGPAAQWRATGDRDDHWFDELCDLGAFEQNADFTRPFEYASRVTRSENQAFQFLRLVARWTDELMANPRVWATVEALVEHLPYDAVLSGARACEIMQAAWGDDAAIPYRSLGRTWRYRLQIRRPRKKKKT